MGDGAVIALAEKRFGASASAEGLRPRDELDIGKRRMGTRGGNRRCASLVSLDLKGNALSDDGVSAVADVLAEIPSLEEVNLSGNDVGIEGALALVECFEGDLGRAGGTV